MITEMPPCGHGQDADVSMSVDGDCVPAAPAREQTRVTFEALYSDHFAFVWRNLRRQGVAEAALRDAAQDVFLVVHRRLPEFAGRGTLQAWLYSIVRRVAADQRRRHRRKDFGEPAETEGIADARELGPEERAARGEALGLLLSLLDGLDEDQRDALVLVDLEGMSVPEVARALDTNPNTVYSRLRAGRQQMRSGLERQSRGNHAG
jgi:RNA polymerase sigma-70 factor (ECF subfamily)